MAVNDMFIAYVGAVLVTAIALFVIWRVTRTDHDDD